MKGHSPNFDRNLREAETAEFHMGRTASLVFAIAVLVALAIL